MNDDNQVQPSSYDAWELTRKIDACTARLDDLHDRRAEQVRVMEDLDEKIEHAEGLLNDSQEEFRVRYLGLGLRPVPRP